MAQLVFNFEFTGSNPSETHEFEGTHNDILADVQSTAYELNAEWVTLESVELNGVDIPEELYLVESLEDFDEETWGRIQEYARMVYLYSDKAVAFFEFMIDDCPNLPDYRTWEAQYKRACMRWYTDDAQFAEELFDEDGTLSKTIHAFVDWGRLGYTVLNQEGYKHTYIDGRLCVAMDSSFKFTL